MPRLAAHWDGKRMKGHPFFYFLPMARLSAKWSSIR